MRPAILLFVLGAGVGLAAGEARAAPENSTLPFYPPAAMKARIEGKAMINCRITASAGLADCRVVSESPEGQGFGAAALQMAPTYKMDPAVRQGQPDAARIPVPINFTQPRRPRPAPLYTPDATRITPR